MALQSVIAGTTTRSSYFGSRIVAPAQVVESRGTETSDRSSRLNKRKKLVEKRGGMETETLFSLTVFKNSSDVVVRLVYLKGLRKAISAVLLLY